MGHRQLIRSNQEVALMKTLAIRLEEDQHAQLGMIAQLEELTVTDAIRQAIEQWIEARRSNPQLQARAEAVLADIDRDAATRRDAIATLLGQHRHRLRHRPSAGEVQEAPRVPKPLWARRNRPTPGTSEEMRGNSCGSASALPQEAPPPNYKRMVNNYCVQL